ncbi:MAG: DUF5818 domain-containing protein [Terriglobia bacterium]|jgi:hypothetical protein
MKKFVAITVLTLGLTVSAMAAQFKGFVEDANCATKPAMKGNAECAQKCIKGGAPAVLVGADGTVYKIANQDKIVAFAGKNVTVKGTLSGDTITVTSVK